MYGLKNRNDLNSSKYDILKLHGLASETIQSRKENEKKKTIANLRTNIQILEMKTSVKAKNRLQQIKINDNLKDLSLLKKKLEKLENTKTDYLTEYLLESLPILNEVHLLNAKISTEKNQHERQKLEFEVSKIVDSYVNKFFPEMKKRRKHDENRVENFIEMNKSSCCGKQLVQTDTSALVCPECGFVQIQNSVNLSNPLKNLSYSRNISSSQGFSYRRVNHLREWLRSQQSKSSCNLPKEILNAVRAEAAKSTRDRKTIDGTYIKKILKRLKLHSYYENSISIAKILNPDLHVLKLDPAYEEKIIGQFCSLEIPYEKIRKKIDPKRKNFLSYPFTFYRLNELNKRPELNKGIKLLKSVKLINRQDKFFKALMKEVDWKYLGSTISF